MRVLITNDDGVYSPGLWSAVKALVDLGEIVVVAPDRDQSGVGLATTLLGVVRAQEIAHPVEGVTTYSVQGTPSDCVILATETLVEKPFDLVVSGVNNGANLGLDIMISGTVGGAMQGYLRDIPSIAVSVTSLNNARYEAAGRTIKALARAISDVPLSTAPLLNVNLPNIEPHAVERVQVTSLGPRAYMESVEQMNDGRRTHYWIRHNKPTNPEASEGTDVWAVRNNGISITPLDLVFADGGSPRAYDVLADAVAAELKLTPRG